MAIIRKVVKAAVSKSSNIKKINLKPLKSYRPRGSKKYNTKSPKKFNLVKKTPRTGTKKTLRLGKGFKTNWVFGSSKSRRFFFANLGKAYKKGYNAAGKKGGRLVLKPKKGGIPYTRSNRLAAAAGRTSRQAGQIGTTVLVASIAAKAVPKIGLAGAALASGAGLKATSDFVFHGAKRDIRLSTKRQIRQRIKEVEQEKMGLTGTVYRDLTQKQRNTINSRTKRAERRLYKGLAEGKAFGRATKYPKKKPKVGRPRTVFRKRGPKRKVGRPKGSIKRVGQRTEIKRVSGGN